MLDRLLSLTFAPLGGPERGWPKLLSAVLRGYWFKLPCGDKQIVGHADPADGLYSLALVLAGELPVATTKTHREDKNDERSTKG